jgi:hypothetical protein
MPYSPIGVTATQFRVQNAPRQNGSSCELGPDSEGSNPTATNNRLKISVFIA